ncbi:E3 ubiquitin-protein ligase rnf181 [Phtheirospermum japonicum]|uniref:RING-type E3 ubiquitin transferase n=1 Tax=Phtheirospermum japonicum TaxID=374723 RepID=A0A830DIM6_9LAMI|nr:E3 ubiquitin-protein ligase rnf181 [Phtheirospermum japonicum]
MTSLTTEPPTLRFIPSITAAAAPHRRSYSCYNCNHSFHITPTAATDPAASPSSFRCPRCHHRHLIPHHTISPTPQPPPPPTPPPPLRNPDYASDSNLFIYQTSDESESDGDDYDSDNSLLSFTAPNFHPCTPALKSFVVSLPIKTFPPNSTPSLQSCSICMEDFELKSDTPVIVNELPCEHYFHKDCIVEWLQRSNTCPLCRYKLPVDPSSEGGIETGTNRWEVEYDAVLVVDLSSIREPVSRRVNGEELGSGSDRRDLGANGAETSGGDLDAMRDEDGDVLMIDA